MNSVGDFVKRVLDHSHAPDARTSKCRKVLQEIRVQAASTNDPPRRILRAVTSSVDERISSVELPSNSNMTRTIRRVRKKVGNTPKNPKTLAELIVEGRYLNTLKGETFMLYDSGNGSKRIIIFSTHTNLSFLSYCDEWYMDGTFDVAPSLFYQLYTVHGTSLIC